MVDFLQFPQPEQHATWQEWAQALKTVLLRQPLTVPIQLPPFPVQKLPAPNTDGMLVFVTDDITGPQPAYSYAGEWLRISDSTPVQGNVFARVKPRLVRVFRGNITGVVT